MQLSKQIHRRTVATRASRLPVRPIVARFGGRGNVLDKPDIEIKTGGPNSDSNMDAAGGPKTMTESGSGGIDKQRSTPPGGGNYRVILLKSPSHTEQGVVRAITTVVPNVDKEHAANCYATSVSLGMALVVSVLKEHAEMYRLQLFKLGCKTAIEPDTTTA